MGRRGPAPTPTRLKILRGNPGKRPLPQNEPQPTPGIPECPDWLLPEAKREWERVVPELASLGLLSRIDHAAFEGYCQAYARWKEAEEFISKYGPIFKTPSGYIQQVPQVSIAHKNLALMRVFAQELGLTPASRTRINLGSANDDDQFEAYLRERPG